MECWVPERARLSFADVSALPRVPCAAEQMSGTVVPWPHAAGRDTQLSLDACAPRSPCNNSVFLGPISLSWKKCSPTKNKSVLNSLPRQRSSLLPGSKATTCGVGKGGLGRSLGFDGVKCTP